MKRTIFTIGAALFFLALNTAAVVAQSKVQNNGSYSLVSHVFIGTSESARAEIRPSLEKALLVANTDFNYKGFRHQQSFLQAIGNGGNIGFQGLMKGIGSLETSGNPVFTEWSMGGFRVAEDDPNAASLQSFRFNARVPVKYAGIENEQNRSTFVKYEALKIGLSRVSLTAGKPIVVGTLPVPNTDETIFIVLELKGTP